MRRTAVATLIALAVLTLGALPASAAVTMTIGSPSAGQEISSATATQVHIRRQLFDPSVSDVELRLVRGGTPTAGAKLSCTQGCNDNEQIWGQLQLQPSSPDEFGVSHPLANGSWTVQSRWRNGSNGSWSAWGADVQITLSVPPSAVSGLAADADLRDVTLTWQRAPEPDISAYRIQRRPDGGSWTVVDSTDGSASSYSETVPSAGAYEYRVVTVRPNGDGGALTATSQSVSVTATSPSPSPSPTGSSSDGGGTTGGSTGGSSGGSTGGVQQGDDTGDDTTDGGTDSSGDDATTGDASGEPSDGSSSADGSGAGAEGTGGDAGSTSNRSYGRSRVAAPPGARQGASLDVDADLPDPEVAPEAEERFFGEGEGFSEELEYGAADAVLPEPDGEQDAVLRRMPGGIQEFIVSRFETRTLLTSIAAGLLFVTLGLHVFRWMRATAHE
ncbi:MAG: fibronectin type III domain-containing protein [Actinobacteria bacterium]|nr:fibronectin type III domain-containing protein [Actinomycetota bacterium]